MRVLHCIHSLVDGGAQRQLRLLAANSARHDMQAAIVCVNDSGGELLDGGVKIYKTSSRNRYNLSLFPALGNAIRDFSPDVMHVWLPASVTVPGLIIAKRYGLPVVFAYRNPMRFDRARTLMEFVTVVALSTGVATNSPIAQSARPYRALYRAKRGVTIPNAVDVGGCAKSEHWSRNRPLRLLFIGRLTKEKNVDCLLAAFTRVKESAALQLTICGEGENRSSVERSVRHLGLDVETTLLGFRRDVYKIMCEHDLLVLPSWSEGMPNVVLEAFAIGLPCIISDIPAHRLLVGDGDCALLFDPGSPEQLARRILEFMSLSDCGRKMTEMGKRVATAYTIDTMCESYRAYYESLITERRRVKAPCT